MINLIVIYCNDINLSKGFYECFGISFVEEKHGKGPIHFSCELDGIILELYPKGDNYPSRNRLGFKVNSLEDVKMNIEEKYPRTTIKTIQRNSVSTMIVTDLDGRKIETTE